MRRILAVAALTGFLVGTGAGPTQSFASESGPPSKLVTALLVACVSDPSSTICDALSKAITDGGLLGSSGVQYSPPPEETPPATQGPAEPVLSPEPPLPDDQSRLPVEW